MSDQGQFPQTPPGFTATTFTHDGKTKTVYRAGKGPAVVIMSEIPGITPQVVRFARYVIDSGFSVYMPERRFAWHSPKRNWRSWDEGSCSKNWSSKLGRWV